MDADAKLQAVAQQQGAAAVSDGQKRDLRTTRAGELLTADWRTNLVLSGFAYRVTVGGISAGAAESLITGGGNGTVINTDRPELAVGVAAGVYLIPLGFHCSVRCAMASTTETGEIMLLADTDKNIPAPVIATSTLEVPANLLGGGKASVARAQSAVNTTDIVDPVASQILVWKTLLNSDNGVAANAVTADLTVDWEPSYLTLLKGPCSVIGVWGGTAATPGACIFDWAEVPIEYFE